MMELFLATVFSPGLYILGIVTQSFPRKTFNQHVQLEFGAIPRMIGGFTDLFVPVRESECEIIIGETSSEAAVKLAIKLKETNVV